MDLFKEIKEPRSLLFGMKITRSEAEWLRSSAMREGVSKSSFVRKLLASIVGKEDHAVGQLGEKNGR